MMEQEEGRQERSAAPWFDVGFDFVFVFLWSLGLKSCHCSKVAAAWVAFLSLIIRVTRQDCDSTGKRPCHRKGFPGQD